MLQIRRLFTPSPVAKVESKKPAVTTTRSPVGTDGFDTGVYTPKKNIPAQPLNVRSGQGGGQAQSIPEPTWLTRGQRPPWVNAQTWNRLPAEDQQAMLGSIRQGWQSHVQSMEPAWLRNGTRPPYVSPQMWNHLPPEDRQDILGSARQRWNGYVQEEMGFYFGGVPAGGGQAGSPLVGVRDGGSWGAGTSGEWQTFHKDGQKPIAQFLNVGQILNPNGDFTHGNLCGELSVMSAMGYGVAQGLRLFNQVTGGSGILSSGSITNSTHLESFFQQGHWRILGQDPELADLNGNVGLGDRAYNNNHLQGDPTPAQLQGVLDQGASLVVLVNINGAKDGMLEGAGTSTNDITHWVNVLSVTESPSGQTYVRVYNPYQNREEVYSWSELQAAWQSPSASETGYTYVAAMPPAR